jgi:hypothetical protein
LVCRSGGSNWARLRSRCLADPDQLLELAEKARGPSGACDPTLLDQFSRALHDLRMGGAWKRTNRGRLPVTEAMLRKHIASNQRRHLTLVDLGASDGITTCEAVQSLRAAWGGEVTAYLTDLNLWLLRYRSGPVIEYRASNGEPVMARVGAFGIRLAEHRRGMSAARNRLAQWYLERRSFRQKMQLVSKISLVSPAVAADRAIIVSELDCLTRADGLDERVDAVRASNVLNLGYFGPDQIAAATGHLHAYLRLGGCLIVSRNSDTAGGEVENGSVWLKRADGFEWVEDFGSGSEIKAIVSAWSSPAAAPSGTSGARSELTQAE